MSKPSYEIFWMTSRRAAPPGIRAVRPSIAEAQSARKYFIIKPDA
jgi:hypothetical protein